MKATCIGLIVISFFSSSRAVIDWQKLSYQKLSLIEQGKETAHILNEPIKMHNRSITLLSLACQLDYELMDKLLAAGADPEIDDCPGSKRAVSALLQHGATFKKSQRSPLYAVFNHYAAVRSKCSSVNKVDNQKFDEMFETLQLLCTQQVDPNQYWANIHPLKQIINNTYLHESERKEIAYLLMVYGSNPDIPNSTYDKKSVFEHYKYNDWYFFLKATHRIIQKRALAQKAWQLIVAWYKEPDSAIAQLPKDILKIICGMVTYFQDEPIL